MSLHRKLRMTLVIVGLAIAAAGYVGAAIDDASAALPKDPCALLKPSEIQAALAPAASIGSGVPDTSALPLGVSCTYTWGPRTSEWGQTAIEVAVIDGSKSWPGTDPDVILQGVLAKAAASPDGSQLPGIGDAAVFTIEARSYNATAEAYFKVKNVHLSVTFHAGSPLQNKGKVSALLKEAAGRL